MTRPTAAERRALVNLLNELEGDDSVLGQVRTQLAKDEHIRFYAYGDTEGFMTAGIGHKLTEEDDPNDPRWADMNFVKEHFWRDSAKALREAEAVIGTAAWAKLPTQAKVTFANMAFQLGEKGFSKFEDTLAAARKGDFEAVARGALDSVVARSQTPNRWHRHASRMLALHYRSQPGNQRVQRGLEQLLAEVEIQYGSTSLVGGLD